MTRSPCILYLDTIPGNPIQKTTLAGIERYARSRGWGVEAVPVAESRPGGIPALLAARAPVAGCIVECADGRRDLPPRLFRKVPVVYLHAAPSLYGGHGMRVNSDNGAIAAAAFRELSACRPAAFAAASFAGFIGRRAWSSARERAFAALAAKSGKPFFPLPWKRETEERRKARLAAWLSALPPRTAVFAVNDFTAAEVADAARQCGRSIPRDLTLLGVDNNARLCETSRPTLSSLQLDHERAGFLAARLLTAGSPAARMKGRASREMKGLAEREMKCRASREMKGLAEREMKCRASREMKGLAEREMKGRAPHEMKGAAYAANEINSSFGGNAATLHSREARSSFEPKAHASSGGNAATLHCGTAAPSFEPKAHASFAPKAHTIAPLLAVRRDSTRGGGRCEPHVLEAVGIIRRMAFEGLTVEALARQLPGSRSLLDLRFREAMGHSIYEEILQVRLERVFDLLRRPDIPIGAIADFCGFRTHHALDKLFRSRFKCSMGAWRRRNASLA